MTKGILSITVLTLFIFGCNSKSPKEAKQNTLSLIKSQDSIDRFWKWFESNEKNLREFKSNHNKILTQVLDSARKIDSGLAIEFEPPKTNVINVTISADGNRDLFPVVQKIVEKAPKIDGWNFVAFRQRIPKEKIMGMVIKMQDVEINPDKMKFFPLISGDSLDIIIYAKDVTESNFNQIAYGGLLLVDNILGEYDCVKKVRKYDFQNMPTSQEELRSLRPMLNLAEYVDNFHKSKHN